jgi:transcriptional regulator with XRE-family HTH domain
MQLSQEALADRCGFARSYMSRIERGKANPSLDAIETLAGGLKVAVVKFVRGVSAIDAGEPAPLQAAECASALL